MGMTEDGLCRTPIVGQNIFILYTNAGRESINKSEQLRFFEYYSLAHLYSGEGILEIPGKAPIPLKAGQAILISPGFIHYYGQTKNQKFFEDNICFYGPLADFLFEKNYLSNGIVEIGQFRELLPICELASSKDMLERIKGCLLFQQLLIKFAENSKKHDANLVTVTDIDQLLYYIWQNPAKWWTVSEMAEYCNMNSERFRTQFFKKMNIRPKDYVDNYKIDLAKNWLAQSNWTIEHISTNLGYSDKFHFSRRFKALVGVSPDLYRQQNK